DRACERVERRVAIPGQALEAREVEVGLPGVGSVRNGLAQDAPRLGLVAVAVVAEGEVRLVPGRRREALALLRADRDHGRVGPGGDGAAAGAGADEDDRVRRGGVLGL